MTKSKERGWTKDDELMFQISMQYNMHGEPFITPKRPTPTKPIDRTPIPEKQKKHIKKDGKK